ncbi:hypothetical protein KIPB_013738, partial [Kipferlia bialata]
LAAPLSRIKQHGEMMGDELSRQAQLMDEFHTEVKDTNTKAVKVTNKVTALAEKMRSNSQMCMFLIVLVVFLAVLMIWIL